MVERFELGEAGREIESFIWDELCDWYLEITKTRLRSGDEVSPLPVLLHVLDACLRLLHPYMPYVTEEIWSGTGELRTHLPEENGESVMMAAFPRSTGEWLDDDAEHELTVVQDIVRAVRNLRRERNIDAGRWLETYVVCSEAILRHQPAIELLARVRPLHIIASAADAPSEGVASAVVDEATVIIPMAGLFDVAAERANLEKQLAQAEAEVDRLQTQLSNEKFTSSAPENVVQAARERLEAAQNRVESLRARLRELG